MPLYRITIDMIFETPDPMEDILDKVQDHQDQAITINPGQPNEEHSWWHTQECHHAEDPTTPCVDTGHWQSS